MADAARPGGDDDEALQILRRLEPALSDIKESIGRLDRRVEAVETRLENIEIRVGNLETRVGNLETHVQNIDGRVSQVEKTQWQQGESLAELRGQVSQLPNLLQIVTAMVGVNAVIVASAFGLARLIIAFG